LREEVTMNIARHPELLDKLAASYAIGTLKGAARRRFEAYARQSPAVRASALLWQTRIQALTELPTPITPSVNVWKRIELALAQELKIGRTPFTAMSNNGLMDAALAQLRRTASWWRGAAAVGAMATLAAIVVGVQSTRSLDAQVGQLSAQLKTSQQAQYVAVLSDDKSAATVLVTFDVAKGSLTLKRVGNYQEANDKSLQLWALPTGGAPQSLGVMGNDQIIRIAAQPQQVVSIPMLAISLEPKGGVPSATGPTGPVLFKGALLKTEL
jgi:anti-sigma-K factor RskA